MEEKGSMMNRTIKAAVGMVAIAAMSVGTLGACGSSSSSDDGKGKVYYLNFKPESNDEWQKLAKDYTKETGVEVKVQTAASGTYEQTLKSEIAKSEAPTLFQVNGPVGYQNWKSYTDDMTDTEPYKQLINKDVALKDGSKVVGVPYAMETYGLIYNKDLLAKYIATDGAKIKDVKDIDNFDTLKAVADDIQAKKDQLGVKGAFTSAGFDSSSDWRFKTHLANLPLYYEFKDDNITKQPATVKGTYLPEYKNIFDLYLKDSTTEPTQLSSKTGDDATSEFSLGEAVFYQNGTWAWTDLQKNGMKAESIGMLPIYTGVKGEESQGLATGSENYWCINSKASDADKQATKDFLKWVVTSKTGAALQDIRNVIGRRWPAAKLLLCPVNVQGFEAAQQIADAIGKLDKSGRVDEIIVARGGGSREDLWVFNAEVIARAAYRCKVPLISAIGHEIDFTILDFVADRRAPTPSAAAELAVPDRAELLRVLSQLEQSCQNAMQNRLDTASGRLMMAEQQLSYDMTRRKLTGGQAELAAVQKELDAAAQSCIQKRQAQLRHAAALADSLSPYRVLGRGYAMVYDSKGRLCSTDALAAGDKLTLRGAAHTAECMVTSVEELNESTQKL